MKTRLDQLTVSQFIDLLCGNTAVIIENEESPSEGEKANAMRRILFEYREIADAHGIRSYLTRMEDLVKARLALGIMGMCQDLLSLERHDLVRGILEDMDINTGRMGNARVEAEVMSQKGRAESIIEEIEGELRLESDNSKGLDVRRQFDEQTATMMAHFKFQIDTYTMKATLYAHLVARYAREMKALERASLK